MGYEKVTDLSCDTVLKLGGVDEKGKPNPTSIEGYYLGSRKAKTGDSVSTIHVFKTPKGNKGIWGSSDTNTKLPTVPVGTKTMVEFKEKVKIGGGKTKNLFDVFVDRKDTIDTSGLATNNNNDDAEVQDDSVAESSYDSENDEQTDDSTYEEESEETPRVSVKSSSAASDKVKALLNRSNKKGA